MTFLVIALARRRRVQVDYLALLQSLDGTRMVLQGVDESSIGHRFVWYR